MSSRADAIALRSVLVLSAALAFALVIRFCSFDFVKVALQRAEDAAQALIEQIENSERSPAPLSRSIRTPAPHVAREHVKPVKIQQEAPAVTPIAIPPLTSLRVEPLKWSAPLRVPPGKRVGIKFSLGRIRVERDGIDAGIIFRSPSLATEGNRIVLKPLAALDHTPREFWFERGIRVLRFKSLEKQAEEIEVMWGQ